MDLQSLIRVFNPILICVLFHCCVSPTDAQPIRKPTTEELLSAICKLKRDPIKCMQTLKSDTHKPSITELITSTNVALEKTMTESTVATNFFISLEASVLDAKQKEVIKECARLFNETLPMLNMAGLEGDTASLDVNYAADNIANCEDQLSGANVQIPSVAPAIKKWDDSYSVAHSGVNAVEHAAFELLRDELL